MLINHMDGQRHATQCIHIEKDTKTNREISRTSTCPYQKRYLRECQKQGKVL